MNTPKSRSSDKAVLLTVEQVCDLVNLGATTVRKIAKESGAERKIGRSYRVHKTMFFDYIERLYG